MLQGKVKAKTIWMLESPVLVDIAHTYSHVVDFFHPAESEGKSLHLIMDGSL